MSSQHHNERNLFFKRRLTYEPGSCKTRTLKGAPDTLLSLTNIKVKVSEVGGWIGSLSLNYKLLGGEKDGILLK